MTVAQGFYVGVNFMAIDAYLGLGDYYVHLNLFHLVVGVLAIKPMMAVIAAWKNAGLAIILGHCCVLLSDSGFCLT